jgi:hypothetical protein
MIPDSLDTEVYDQTTQQPSTLGSIKSVPGACQLSSQNKNVIAEVRPHSTDNPPGSVIVIADFTPAPSSTEEFIGMDVRCQPSGDCLTVLLNNRGAYGIYQFGTAGGTTLVKGNFNDDQMPLPRLNLGAANRLLVWLKGDHAAVYLNGRLLGVGPTTLPDAPAPLDFTAVPGGAFDGGSGDSAVVNLTHFYVFQAANGVRP